VIQITRSLAQQVRGVFRRLVRKSPVASDAAVSFTAGPDGLEVRLHNREISAAFHQPCPLAPDAITLPLEALADFEGRKKDVVTLERTASGVQVSWQDGVVPQVRAYPAPENKDVVAVRDQPRQTATNEPGFLKALADAVLSTSHDAVRYALDHIQLRGSTGDMVATDGRQLLVQSGFHFPWTDDVLIPTSTVFACRELPQEEPVTLGKTATHVTMTTGPWTLHFPIDTQSRFPPTEQVIPSLTGPVHRARLDPGDREFLAQALPRLPGKAEEDGPVTLDWDSAFVVRARASDGRVTELHLARSEVGGRPVRVGVKRELLARALDLGVQEIFLVSADKPLLFRDARRKLVVMPLGKEAVVGPSDQAVRIASPNGHPASPAVSPEPAPGFAENPTVPIAREAKQSPRLVSKAPPRKAPPSTLAGLVTEAEALRNELRQAYSRTHQLLLALKKHRRQSKLVQSTLATLRQLKSVAG
jgi:hypothetical protein